MQLAYETLLKLNNVSRTEMNIFLQCVRYQDEEGQVVGAYYKYFMDLLGFKSKQTFYNVLRSLSEKKLLSYTQNVKGDYDIHVENQAYVHQEKPDYIDLNKVIFQSKEFFRLKAHEKYMLLDLMRSTALNKGIRVIRVEEFYQKYCKALQVSKRIIQIYLQTLRKYFSVRIKDGKYFIKFLGGKLFEKPKRAIKGKRSTYISNNTAVDQQREYIGTVLLRRKQLARKRQEDALELGKLMYQYRSIIREMGKDVLSVFSTVLHNHAEESTLFDIKCFHKMLRQALKLDN
jgi:hypothetical protein